MIWVKNPGGWGVYCQCVCVDDGLKKSAIALSWLRSRLKSASQIAPSQTRSWLVQRQVDLTFSERVQRI